MSNKLNINQSEYSVILQQAVAEIRNARTLIAKQINSTTNSVYWNLGKLLFEKQSCLHCVRWQSPNCHLITRAGSPHPAVSELAQHLRDKEIPPWCWGGNTEIATHHKDVYVYIMQSEYRRPSR